MWFFTVPNDAGSSSIRLSVLSPERVGSGVTAQTFIDATSNLVSIQLGIGAVVQLSFQESVQCSYSYVT